MHLRLQWLQFLAQRPRIALPYTAGRRPLRRSSQRPSATTAKLVPGGSSPTGTLSTGLTPYLLCVPLWSDQLWSDQPDQKLRVSEIVLQGSGVLQLDRSLSHSIGPALPKSLPRHRLWGAVAGPRVVHLPRLLPLRGRGRQLAAGGGRGPFVAHHQGRRPRPGWGLCSVHGAAGVFRHNANA
jgi:hypothetical protein